MLPLVKCTILNPEAKPAENHCTMIFRFQIMCILNDTVSTIKLSYISMMLSAFRCHHMHRSMSQLQVTNQEFLLLLLLFSSLLHTAAVQASTRFCFTRLKSQHMYVLAPLKKILTQIKQYPKCNNLMEVNLKKNAELAFSMLR